MTVKLTSILSVEFLHLKKSFFFHFFPNRELFWIEQFLFRKISVCISIVNNTIQSHFLYFGLNLRTNIALNHNFCKKKISFLSIVGLNNFQHFFFTCVNPLVQFWKNFPIPLNNFIYLFWNWPNVIKHFFPWNKLAFFTASSYSLV